MKQLLASYLLCSSLLFAACNNAEENSATSKESEVPSAVGESNHASTTEITVVPVTYTSVEPVVEAEIKAVVNHYLQLKNALVKDDAAGAAKGATAMTEAMANLDKSLLNTEQKASYDAIEATIKTPTEAISQHSADLAVQRAHFANLSEGVHQLVKNFGAGQSMYQTFCPMARDNKGAKWISETKEIKNPYFGASMLTCGTVESEIR